MNETTVKKCNIILFDGFETLDAFGPAEILGKLPQQYSLEYFSAKGGMIQSSQNIRVETLPFSQIEANGMILIPGGIGTRSLVLDSSFIEELKNVCQQAADILTVCTGSALLAKTSLLSGKRATTNKRAFDWVCSQDETVLWQKQARWVADGRIYTSSGVSAGMDMTLGWIRDILGEQVSNDICNQIEYIWNKDEQNDPFAIG